MDKKYLIPIGVVVLVVVVVGVVISGAGGKKVTGGVAVTNKQPVKSVGGYKMELKGCEQVAKGGKEVEVWLDVGQDKISALEMVIGSSGGVIVSGVKENKTYFTIMKNKAEAGKWKYVAIVMKKSEELPTGRFLVGTIGYGGGEKSGGMEIGTMEVVKAIVGGQQPEKIKLMSQVCGASTK